MTGGRAIFLWLAVALVAAFAWAMWGVGDYFAAVDDARAATADVAEAEEFRTAIIAARGTADNVRPADAGALVDLTQTINDAFREAKIDADQLAAVSPADPRPLPGSRLVDRRTQLVIRGVTLAQTLGFTRAIESIEDGLSVRDLRLAAPAKGESDLWDLELTLSVLADDAGRGRDAR